MIRQPPSDWFDTPETTESQPNDEVKKYKHFNASSKEMTPNKFLRSAMEHFTYEYKQRTFAATLLENNPNFVAYLLKQYSTAGSAYEIVYVYKRQCTHQQYMMRVLQALPDLRTDENWQVVTTVPFLLQHNQSVNEDHWALHPFRQYFGFELFAPIR